MSCGGGRVVKGQVDDNIQTDFEIEMIGKDLVELEDLLYSKITVKAKYEILETIRFKLEEVYNQDKEEYNEIFSHLREQTREALDDAWKLWNPPPNDGARGHWIGDDKMTYMLSESNPYYEDCRAINFTQCTYDKHGAPDFSKVTFPGSVVDISAMYDKYNADMLSKRGGGGNIQDEAQELMSRNLEPVVRAWWRDNRLGEAYNLYDAFFAWRDSLDLVPHEDTNCTTMRLVSRSAHKAFTHRGGIANAVNIKIHFR